MIIPGKSGSQYMNRRAIYDVENRVRLCFVCIEIPLGGLFRSGVDDEQPMMGDSV
jgi:hypothetical protein